MKLHPKNGSPQGQEDPEGFLTKPMDHFSVWISPTLLGSALFSLSTSGKLQGSEPLETPEELQKFLKLLRNELRKMEPSLEKFSDQEVNQAIHRAVDEMLKTINQRLGQKK